MQSTTYDALRFGDFSTYMRNKRAKLKVQEAQLKEQEDALRAAAAKYRDGSDNAHQSSPPPPPIFKGCTIYITGHTEPPYQELRRLIVLHGGNFMAYLDQKKPVTHIVASNLTPKKREEFREYKVVRPEWVMESIRAGRKLAWHNFRVEADAGGAIGSERLPVGEAANEGRQDGFLAAPASISAPKQSRYLAGATPWGRAVAQKKLTGFTVAENKKAAPAPAPARPPSPPRQPTPPRSPSPSREPSSPPPRISPSRPATPDTSSPITASQEEWLSTLETPPRPKPETPRKDFEALVGTDPVSKSAALAHPYASRSANTTAARLMASPSWRERNTATSESFLSGYFAKSRLHYLSTWKGELKDLVSQALKDAGREDDHLQPLPKGASRVIMHIDFDSFFVSVGLRHRPDLKDKPVVVCHSGSHEGTSSTSEIASCNYVARSFGVHNGWSLGRARQLCPHVQPIPYDFEGYKDVSIQFYSLLLAYADAIEAVSVDEALVDVSRLLQSMRSGGATLEDDDERKVLLNAYRGHVSSQGERWTEEKQLAEALRDEIRRRTGCEASIGIGANTLQARLATRHAKPGGSYHLEPAALDNFLSNLDIDDLQGVGYSTRHRFQALFGTANIAELKRAATVSQFMSELGPKLGRQVWDKMYGIDRAELEGTKQRQSVGAAVNYAIRFKSQEEAERFVRNLSEEVANRLAGYKLKGKQANVTIMVRDPAAPVEAPKFLGHGVCDVHNRSCALTGPGGGATNEQELIFKAAWKLIRGLNADPRELRGIGISCTKLEPTEPGVVKAKPGQRLLSFASAPVTPSKLPRRVDVDEDEDSAEEEEHSALTPGPSALRSQRQPSPPTSPTKPPLEPAMPMPSLVDSPARPVEAPPQLPLSTRSQSLEPMPRPPLPPPPTRAPAPRQVALNLHRLPTPFDRAAATRRGAGPGKSPPPAGPALPLPTMSQLDPSVLGELPPSIREEVLRESRRMATTRSAAAAAATGMSRSLSASPSKRQLAAMKGGTGTSPSSQRLLQFPAIARNPPAPLRLEKDKPASSTHSDPSTISASQLLALGIDAGVFAALPSSVQRETLLAHSREARGKDARSVAGKRHQEVSLAEERRLDAEKARGALDVDDERTYLTAMPVAGREVAKATEEGEQALPSILRRWSFEDVHSLLTSWVQRYATRAPRPNDVNRFTRFLVGSISADGIPGSRMCDLEKVQSLLRGWEETVDTEVDKTVEAAVQGWKKALQGVRAEVDAATRARFGGQLKL